MLRTSSSTRSLEVKAWMCEVYTQHKHTRGLDQCVVAVSVRCQALPLHSLSCVVRRYSCLTLKGMARCTQNGPFQHALLVTNWLADPGTLRALESARGSLINGRRALVWSWWQMQVHVLQVFAVRVTCQA